MSDIIYRLMDQQSWIDVERAGTFAGSADDIRDGFIHFSTAATVRETARRYYAQVADLILLSVKANDLGSALKWEPSRGGILFPHLYAPLLASQISKAIRLDYHNGHHHFGPEFL